MGYFSVFFGIKKYAKIAPKLTILSLFSSSRVENQKVVTYNTRVVKDVFGSKSMGEKNFFSGGRPPGRPKKNFFSKKSKIRIFVQIDRRQIFSEKNFFGLGVPPLAWCEKINGKPNP